MKLFRILMQSDNWVAIDKPAGVRVHPPEDPRYRSAGRQIDVIRILRDQLGCLVYPVHRLDSATSGVLILALNSSTAGLFQQKFKSEQMQKTYLALVRGFTEAGGMIDSPLSSGLDEGPLQEARTQYETLVQIELPIPSSKHPTSRFSLVKISPLTGRYHQIRRHFSRIHHPLIGDTVHGDGKQNRIWRDLTQSSGLYLKAYRLEFTDPHTNQFISLQSRWGNQWQKVFDHAGACPIIPSSGQS